MSIKEFSPNDRKTILAKWAPLINTGKTIKSEQIQLATALVLENTEREMGRQSLMENSGSMAVAGMPVNGTMGGATVGDVRAPQIVVPMLRRVFPELLAHETVGVQPMNGPLGYAYALRLQYGVNAGGVSGAATGLEMGYNNMVTSHTGTTGLSGEDRSGDYSAPVGAGPQAQNAYWSAYAGPNTLGTLDVDGRAMSTASGEFLKINQDMPMAKFKIEKGVVEAKTRKLGANWSRELAEDMLSMHGMDVDAEMANVLSYEVQAEIDRQLIGEMVKASLNGTVGQHFSSWNPTVADGRHQLERIGTLYTQVLLASQRIATNTRRGHANFAIADSSTTALLERVGDYTLDEQSTIANNASVGVSRVGSLRNGTIKLFRDTFGGNLSSGDGYVLLGYKGSTQYDAGLQFCPYIPLQLMRETDPNDFTPRIAVRTRYGILNNLYGSQHFFHFIKVSGLTGTVVADDARIFLQ